MSAVDILKRYNIGRTAVLSTFTVIYQEYGIEVRTLAGTSRKRPVVLARHMAMALVQELTKSSLPTIGDHFGGRDHTTILHAVKKISALRRTDKEFAQEYDRVKRLVQVEIANATEKRSKHD